MLRGFFVAALGHVQQTMSGHLISSNGLVGSKLISQVSPIHTSVIAFAVNARGGSDRWPKKNKTLYEPQEPGEERRPAWVCHSRTNIKYSPKKMWYITALIRGMSIDEALKQLSFVSKKGAKAVKEVLLEAQQMAVEQENVEYKSNLWIGESFVTKGIYIKGLRRHARKRFGKVEYKHCNYYVRLVEGSPPEDFYPKDPNGNEKLKRHLDELRQRRIILSL